ncbi:MAG: tRNA (N(6)-L-threonylcarbamoyladenosine(37)-C(2))-methylthiotransferase MtaB [Opitutales bacterium]
MKKKAYIYHLGCRVNQYEALLLKDIFKDKGYEILDNSKDASLIVVNSCALTSLAKAKTRNTIRHALKDSPNADVLVTGCYAQTDADSLSKIEKVKWVISNEFKLNSAEIIEANPATNKVQHFFPKNALPENSPNFTNIGNSQILDRANIKIQDGCDNACSYCIIPRARGRARSRDFENIIEEAKALSKRGVRELSITGINISQYQHKGLNIINIIDAINEIDDIYRIRIGSVEAFNFPVEEIVERMANPQHKLARHLHISAQTMSEEMLKIMRRNYSLSEFLSTISYAKAHCPDIAIGTDIIISHPKETEEIFLESKNIIEQNDLFSYMHVFSFSPADKTLAKIMPDQVPHKIKQERSKIMRALSDYLRLKFYKSQMNKPREVLLENQLNNKYFAHTDNYIPLYINLPQKNLTNNLALVEINNISNIEHIEAKLIKLL